MNRRRFLKTSCVLGASTLLPVSVYSAAANHKFKMGLQLWSVNKDVTEDTVGTLTALKTMGYEDFETAGFDEKKGLFYGYKPSDFKNILDELQVSAKSGHFWLFPYLDKPMAELRRAVDQCIAGASALNMTYITWPWLSPHQRTSDSYKKLAERLNLIGEQITAAGLGLAYHNHEFEFEDHNGENGFDIIATQTEPELVKLQMDMYWVMHSSSRSPKELVDAYPGRFTMWHIKDMDKVTRGYTELGNGSINYAEIMPDPVKSGLEFYYLEQGDNFTHSPMQSAATSAEYFSEHLRHLL
jgi:sugar phosphate isomerase/epimerase